MCSNFADEIAIDMDCSAASAVDTEEEITTDLGAHLDGSEGEHEEDFTEGAVVDDNDEEDNEDETKLPVGNFADMIAIDSDSENDNEEEEVEDAGAEIVDEVAEAEMAAAAAASKKSQPKKSKSRSRSPKRKTTSKRKEAATEASEEDDERTTTTERSSSKSGTRSRSSTPRATSDDRTLRSSSVSRTSRASSASRKKKLPTRNKSRSLSPRRKTSKSPHRSASKGRKAAARRRNSAGGVSSSFADKVAVDDSPDTGEESTTSTGTGGTSISRPTGPRTPGRVIPNRRRTTILSCKVGRKKHHARNASQTAALYAAVMANDSCHDNLPSAEDVHQENTNDGDVDEVLSVKPKEDDPNENKAEKHKTREFFSRMTPNFMMTAPNLVPNLNMNMNMNLNMNMNIAAPTFKEMGDIMSLPALPQAGDMMSLPSLGRGASESLKNKTKKKNNQRYSSFIGPRAMDDLEESDEFLPSPSTRTSATTTTTIGRQRVATSSA